MICFVFVQFVCCVSTEFAPVESCQSAFNNFLAAVQKNRITEVYYRLSFAVRDKISYRFFSAHFREIRERIIERVLNAQILSTRECLTARGLPARIFVLRDLTGVKRELMLVAEYDAKRFPSERRAIWRFRGFLEPDKNFLFGIFPKPKKMRRSDKI